MHSIRLPPTVKQAFSLVELSIVLVILGLLIGGILSGQALIRAAELRALITEQNRWITATQTFRDKYFAFPGDMPNATLFWGKDSAACNSQTGTASPQGTCNGNGNGSLDWAAAANSTGENIQFWKHMALAGLIEGNYTGIAGSESGGHSIPNINVPASKIGNSSCWTALTIGNFPGSDATDGLYALDYGTGFLVGGADPTDDCRTPVIKPEEAWNIDSKLDDGRPASGKVIARYWNTCARADDGSNANNDLNASYNLADSSKQCAMYFRQSF
jgi:prepilin-type N-terminal cleavage/methylation domain-containing protein